MAKADENLKIEGGGGGCNNEFKNLTWAIAELIHQTMRRKVEILADKVDKLFSSRRNADLSNTEGELSLVQGYKKTKPAKAGLLLSVQPDFKLAPEQP